MSGTQFKKMEEEMTVLEGRFHVQTYAAQLKSSTMHLKFNGAHAHMMNRMADVATASARRENQLSQSLL